MYMADEVNEIKIEAIMARRTGAEFLFPEVE
jgi:hypothetical protein